MKKTLLIVAIAGILCTQCGKGEDPFAIGEGIVGKVTQDVQMRQIDSIFANDSIVKLNPIKDSLESRIDYSVLDLVLTLA